MYSGDKITGLRELFNAVTSNNEAVELLGADGTIDNQIYVRIRGKTSSGRLVWGAGPKTKWSMFKAGKAKNGEMSKTFKAVFDLIKETHDNVQLDEFKKRLEPRGIHWTEHFIDLDHYQIICEMWDAEYVAYKGGRKKMNYVSTDSSSKRENMKCETTLNKKVETDSPSTDKKSGGGKREKLSTQGSAESNSGRW